MKKILLCGYACSPHKGSEEGNSWSWATGLAKLGFEIWCFSNTAFKKEILKATEQLNYPNLHFVFVSPSEFIDKNFLNSGSKKIYIHYALWKYKASKIAKEMHKTIKFDLAHHVSFGSLQQGHFLWKLKDVKIIFGPVGGGQKAPAIFREYFGKAWRTEKLRNLITRFNLSVGKNFKNSLLNADNILANNMETLQMAKNSGYIDESKISLIRGTSVPRDMENLQPPDLADTKTINLLWVGRILPRKGLNLVLEALSKLPPDFDFTFTIVGGGKLFPKIENWIREYQLDKNKITITGQIPFEEVKMHYKKSNTFIFCPLRETFGAQLSEAMAFGLPVITLNIHGASIGVPDNCGIKITPRSKEQTLTDISGAIMKMQSNPSYRMECAQNAYKYSLNNTWENRINYIVEKFY